MLPELECWSECCFDKKREKAKKNVMKLVKKYIDFVREMKKSAELRDEILEY
jgi:hypothetical protein